MKFSYLVCDDDGTEFTLTVEAYVSPFVAGFTSGRPEDCYPDEGGEIEELTVTCDGKNVTDQLDALFGKGAERVIKDEIYRRAKKEPDFYDPN